jgi:energy-coupling factor transporter ATP-binding protein EcfA2
MGKTNPAIAFIANLFLEKYVQEQQSPPQASDIPELAQVPAIQKLKNKHGAVVLIIGRRESGKTILAQRLAEIIGRPVYAVSPEQTPPSWITELRLEQLSESPPPFSTLILDDIPAYMSSRDYNDSFVNVVEKLIPMVRHKRKLILIFNTQTSGQADRWIMDADLLLIKSPNLLFMETERPAVARIYKSVMPIFQQMTDQQQKRHAFLLAQDYRELVRINLPGVESESSEKTSVSKMP